MPTIDNSRSWSAPSAPSAPSASIAPTSSVASPFPASAVDAVTLAANVTSTGNNVTGLVGIGGHRWTFGPDQDAFGTLDHGRGIWPYATRWNWGSASGTAAGRRIGGEVVRLRKR